MMTKRSRLLPLMTTFDFCDTTLPCGQRDVTTVAPQALAMLNNHFVHERSRSFARRLREAHPKDLKSQVRLAWRLALQREPQRDELSEALLHVETQSKHFAAQSVQPVAKRPEKPSLSKKELVLWLKADQGAELDSQKRVITWRDNSPLSRDGLLRHNAAQALPSSRPQWIAQGIGGKPSLRFDGKPRYMQLAGQVLWSQNFTVFSVATDTAKVQSHREIISNWHRRGRSTTSFFLGTTKTGTVRLSDAFQPAGVIQQKNQPFILTGVNSGNEAATYQNERLLRKGGKLATRDLKAPYTIGCQGNYGGEYWQGDIAEIIVYDRALSDEERREVWTYLASKYALKLQPPQRNPDLLALESLCHVLLNTNEFIYVD